MLGLLTTVIAITAASGKLMYTNNSTNANKNKDKPYNREHKKR